MTEKITFIPSRLKSSVVGGHVAGASDIIDDAKNKLQSEINASVEESINDLQGVVGDVDEKIANAIEPLNNTISQNKQEADNKIEAIKGGSSKNIQMLSDEIAQKQPALTFDNAPALGSNNPVKSDGIKRALNEKQDSISDLAAIRTGAARGATALQEHQSLVDYYNKSQVDDKLAQKQDSITIDQTPTVNSGNPISSDAVYDLQEATKEALNRKQETLTWDLTPTLGSGNPVTSGGVAAALEKGNKIEFVEVSALPAPTTSTTGSIYVVRTDDTYKWYVTVFDTALDPASYAWKNVNTAALDFASTDDCGEAANELT